MAIYKPKGRNVYMMDFVFQGHRIYQSTGFKDRKRAQRVHDNRLDALKEGKAGLRREEGRVYLLGEAAREWRNTAPRPRGRRKTPWSRSMEAIADGGLKRILPYFGEDRLLADISARDLNAYQDARLRGPKQPSNRTINMELGVLRKILIHAGHWERIKKETNPPYSELPEREDVGRALTVEQEALLLEECARSVSRALLPFVTLALDTGARYNTIRTLQWGRVNLERGIIQIGKDKTAAGTGRTVPLNGRALQTLRFWADQFPDRRPEHYVFPAELYGLHGKKGHFGGEVRQYGTEPKRPVGSIKSAWQAAKRRTRLHCPKCTVGRIDPRRRAKGHVCAGCAATFDDLPAGLSAFRFHDLRHTAVSRLIVARVPSHIIATIVGWEPSTVVAMAERYGHFEEDVLRRAVEAICAPPAVPAPYVSTYATGAKRPDIQ